MISEAFLTAMSFGGAIAGTRLVAPLPTPRRDNSDLPGAVRDRCSLRAAETPRRHD